MAGYLFVAILVTVIGSCCAYDKSNQGQVSWNVSSFERCTHIKVKPLHIEEKVCVLITYLSAEIGFELSMTWEGKTVFSTKISVKNPPDLCFKLPITKVAKACLKVTDVSFKPHHHGACLSLELKLWMFKKTFKLGCIYKALGAGGELKEDWYEARTNGRNRYKDSGFMESQFSRPRDVKRTAFGAKSPVKCVCPKPRRCMCCNTMLMNTRVCGRIICSKKGKTLWLDLFVNNNKNFRAMTPVARRFTVVCGNSQIANINSSVCLQLSNMNQVSQQLSGCITAHVVVKTLHKQQELGCFSLKYSKVDKDSDGLLKFEPQTRDVYTMI